VTPTPHSSRGHRVASGSAVVVDWWCSPDQKKKKNKKLATAAGIVYTCTLDALRIYASLGLWNVMRGFVDDRQPRRAAAVYLELNLIAVKTRQLSRIRVSTLVLFHQCF
jgi:hypothetical protein